MPVARGKSKRISLASDIAALFFFFFWRNNSYLETGMDACRTFPRQQEYPRRQRASSIFFCTAVDPPNGVDYSSSLDIGKCQALRISRWNDRATLIFFRFLLVSPPAVRSRDAVDIISGGYISRGFMDAFADLPCLALIGIFSRRLRKRSRGSTIYSRPALTLQCDARARASFPHLNTQLREGKSTLESFVT